MRPMRGFTLLELLVAIAIFAVMSAIAYGGITTATQAQARVNKSTERLREIQSAVRRLSTDLYQIQPRPVRDVIGDGQLAAVQSGAGAEYALELTTGGWSNPLGVPRSTLQRVAYGVEDGNLVRFHWASLDRTLATQPLRSELVTGVLDMRVRFLDEAREWHEDWPQISEQPADGLRLRPLAVEFSIELDDKGVISRLVEIGR